MHVYLSTVGRCSWVNISISIVVTWVSDVLQVAQVELLGDGEQQLGRLAVLVAGRQLQGGQFLSAVLVQDQALVHLHHRGQSVHWEKRGQNTQQYHLEGHRQEGGGERRGGTRRGEARRQSRREENDETREEREGNEAPEM